MNSKERDALLERHVQAAEDSARFSLRSAQALEAPEQERRQREFYAAFPKPNRLLASVHGARTMLKAIPGFAGLWEKEVPATHLEVHDGRDRSTTTVVRCTCGALTALPAVGVAQCTGGRFLEDGELLDPGGCCRFFFALSHTSVRVRLFPAAGQ